MSNGFLSFRLRGHTHRQEALPLLGQTVQVHAQSKHLLHTLTKAKRVHFVSQSQGITRAAWRGGEGVGAGASVGGRIAPTFRKRDRQTSTGAHSAFFLSFSSWMVPTTLSVGLPSSLRPLWERPHRHLHRCIYSKTSQADNKD